MKLYTLSQARHLKVPSVLTQNLSLVQGRLTTHSSMSFKNYYTIRDVKIFPICVPLNIKENILRKILIGLIGARWPEGHKIFLLRIPISQNQR